MWSALLTLFSSFVSIIWFDKTQILESLTKKYRGNTIHNVTDAVVAYMMVLLYGSSFLNYSNIYSNFI